MPKSRSSHDQSPPPVKWTPEMQAAALAEGWGVFPVIDNGTKRVGTRILSAGRFKHATAALLHVRASAQSRSVLHLNALKAVMLNWHC